MAKEVNVCTSCGGQTIKEDGTCSECGPCQVTNLDSWARRQDGTVEREAEDKEKADFPE